MFLQAHGNHQNGLRLVHHPERKQKNLPTLGFEPGSPQPQSKSDDLDRSAMGPAFSFLECYYTFNYKYQRDPGL